MWRIGNIVIAWRLYPRTWKQVFIGRWFIAYGRFELAYVTYKPIW